MISVNSHKITEHSLLQEMQYHPAASQREAMMKAAESLIIGQLLRQRANVLGIKVGSDEESASDKDFIAALIAQEVIIPTATQEECELYFQHNQKRFMSSPIVEARHILLAADPKNDNARLEAKLVAEEVILQLHRGQSFGALALSMSACPSKVQGGNLGQVSRGQTVPEFERTLMMAHVGLLAHPIETRYGFHVVYVDGVTPGHALAFADVYGRIEQYLNEKVRRKAIAQYILNLIADSDIDGYDFNAPVTPLLQ